MDEVELDIGHYRSLTLLNALYNESFASIIVPLFKTLMEVCSVICAYGTIRFYGRIPFEVYQLLPGLCSVLFIEHQFAVTNMATVHENSSRIGENYKQNYLMTNETTMSPELKRHRKYIKTFLYSCRPLRCQLTQVLFVEKETRLVLLNMMLNMLVTLLLGDHEN